MAASLHERFGIAAELIKGSGGTFDVNLDGVSVFSKRSAGRFPTAGEVEAAIAARIGPQPG